MQTWICPDLSMFYLQSLYKKKEDTKLEQWLHSHTDMLTRTENVSRIGRHQALLVTLMCKTLHLWVSFDDGNVKKKNEREV